MSKQITTSQKKILFSIVPNNIKKADKDRIIKSIKKSLDNLENGDPSKVAEGITEFKRMMRAIDNKWEDCGDHCHHFLLEGDPAAYGVCYWSCIIDGGPTELSLKSSLSAIRARNK